MNFLVKIISTFFFSGYIPFMSGTFASILGLLLWGVISKPYYYYALTGVMLGLGFLTSGYAEREVFKNRDDGRIVIDEVAGMLIVFLTFRFTFTVQGIAYLLAGFAVFRFLDIVKPPPIKALERLKGGLGIMLDDIVAGAIAHGILQVLRIFLTGLSSFK